MTTETEEPTPLSRRDLLRRGGMLGAMIGLGGLAGMAARGSGGGETTGERVWQLDPDKCIQCGLCATECVLEHSAVRCVHAYRVCGYCDLCLAYYKPQPTQRDTSAENQLCPTFALIRKHIEYEYYEYTVIEERCIGCGKCVFGCQSYGNGSLYLQVRHHICRHCNECRIAKACPANAFRRLPAEAPYLLKGPPGSTGGDAAP